MVHVKSKLIIRQCRLLSWKQLPLHRNALPPVLAALDEVAPGTLQLLRGLGLLDHGQDDRPHASLQVGEVVVHGRLDGARRLEAPGVQLAPQSAGAAARRVGVRRATANSRNYDAAAAHGHVRQRRAAQGDCSLSAARRWRNTRMAWARRCSRARRRPSWLGTSKRASR